MSLYTASLNSGSNGNCYYVGNEHTAVLVDVGISCREVERRMRRIGLDIEKVKAIFISHEHGDHIRGVEVLSRRYQLPVYVTEQTLRYVKVDGALVRYFKENESVELDGLMVKTFRKFHDAVEPHSFLISHNGITVGVLTDIGAHCENVIHHFAQCHACFLESNYDEGLLESGRYPWPLKQRIRGGHGHLSNRQAFELFTQHRPEFMTHIFLSHLSRDNNDPELALATFASSAHGVHVSVASRYEPSEVFLIDGARSVIPNAQKMLKAVQASLF